MSGSASGTVYDATPVINSVYSAAPLVAGDITTNVQISGSNFGTNQPQVTFSLGGTIQVTSYSDTQIVVTITPATAGTGTFQVTAEGFAGQPFQPSPGQSQQSKPSPQIAVSAPVPTSLKVVSAGLASPNCPGSMNYGVYATIQYQVLDQNTPPQPMKVAGMTPYESGVWFDGGTLNLHVLGAATDADGKFTDTPVGA